MEIVGIILLVVVVLAVEALLIWWLLPAAFVALAGFTYWNALALAILLDGVLALSNLAN